MLTSDLSEVFAESGEPFRGYKLQPTHAGMSCATIFEVTRHHQLPPISPGAADRAADVCRRNCRALLARGYQRSDMSAVTRAAVYRLLATGPLPSARDAIEALRQPHAAKVSMEEMAALLRSCVDEGDPTEDACVTECLRRLREAGDGARPRQAALVRRADRAARARGDRLQRVEPQGGAAPQCAAATPAPVPEPEPEPEPVPEPVPALWPDGGTAEWLVPEGAEDKAERVLFLHGG
eukprot:scaffold65796_cov57-Phaeocystis_antarctica.AAC.1